MSGSSARDVGEPSARAGHRASGTPGVTRRATALPLGGLGAGHVAIAADGSLRQWQLGNTVNHTGFVPDSFFAIRVSGEEPPLDVRRTLRSAPESTGIRNRLRSSPTTETPHDPAPPTATWPAVEATEMTVGYPFARIDVSDPSLPVAVVVRVVHAVRAT